MEQLVNVSLLAKEFRLDRGQVKDILKDTKPKMTGKYGRGEMRLYDPKVVRPLVRDWLHAREAAKAVNKAPRQLDPVPQEPVISLSGMQEQIAALTEELQSLRVRLTGQNQALLTAITHVREEQEKITKALEPADAQA